MTLYNQKRTEDSLENKINMIIEASLNFPNDVPPNYVWMTYNQIHAFMLFSNYVNIQSRSLLSYIKACDEEIS